MHPIPPKRNKNPRTKLCPLGFKYFSVLMFVFTTSQALAQNENENLAETTDGLTFTDGVFYPTYSIQGMVYNSETKSYMPPAESPPPSPDSSANSTLPDAGPLLEGYNNSGNQTDYVRGLTSQEQASVFLGLSPEQRPGYITHIHPPNTSDQALLNSDRERISNFLSMIPDSNLLDTLDLITNYDSPIFPGAPLSWGTVPTGAYTGLNLSGRNLSGWDVTGKNLSSSNLSNTQLTAAQLNTTIGDSARGPLSFSNLSGLNLIGLDMSRSKFIGTNFADSNITAAQINNIVPHAYYPWLVNLSGRDLNGVDMSNRILENSNFSYATGLSATQLAKAKSLTGSHPTYTLNLVGTGINQNDLEAALTAEGKTANMANIIFGP